MATLVSFRVAGWSADEVAEALGRRVHAIVRSIPGLDVVRLSVAFFTTEDELRRVLDAVEEVAGHTPASLPTRPAIEFLDRAPE
jgi:selenocysteine lyase/cysteine desulfurase